MHARIDDAQPTMHSPGNARLSRRLAYRSPEAPLRLAFRGLIFIQAQRAKLKYGAF